MPEALYAQHFNKPFQKPHDLGKYPDNIPTSVSTHWRSKILTHLKAAKQVYNTFKAVIQCNQNRFQEAIQEDYLA